MKSARPMAGLPTLQSILAGGGTVVTATRRLARALQTDYARLADARSWRTPDAVPWSAWLQATFAELRDFGVLGEARPCLDDAQAAALWEELVAADTSAGALLMPGQAADGFRQAWQLVHDWQLGWAAIEARAGEDCRTFLRVAAAYRRRLDSLGYLDTAQLPGVLAGILAGQPGPEVVLAGFDRLNPAQRAIEQALGDRVRRAAGPAHQAQPGLAAFPCERAELGAAADWARSWLERDPEARLCIVVPDLDAQAALVEDVLDEFLAPDRLLPLGAAGPRPWNVSLGPPLADVPMIASALASLELGGRAVDAAAVGRWLRSPFIAAAATEGGERARLDAWLRANAGPRLSPEGLLGWLNGRDGAPSCPQLGAALRVFLDTHTAGARLRRPSAWSEAWARGLQALGWPGDAPLDSAGWQTQQAWVDLLDDFARLDLVLGPVSLAEALPRLRRLAGQRRFQPESPEAPVQVLGLLETAGLEFDGLWVSGVHDGVLPAPLRPCALLPPGLQRELGMPGACADTELAAGRRLVEALTRAAPEVTFSYPVARDDEPLRPSPLVSIYGGVDLRVSAAPGQALRAVFEAREFEWLEDMVAPSVSGRVRGGTALLAAQSACPFSAFAVHRLRAERLESPAAGVDPLSRGLFLHDALYRLWASFAGQAGLAALPAEERARQARDALERAAARHLASFPAGLVRIEVEDGARRIAELMGVELARPGFSVIGRELEVLIELGPLTLRGKVDRLDEVADGLVVLDYKTGAAGPGDWAGERPAQPQLPLYALNWHEGLVGLAYASLKPGAVGLRGLGRDGGVFGEALSARCALGEEAWREQLGAWRTALEALAGAYAAGDARVDPLRPHGENGTCARCHLATLCRRDELARAGALGND